ncbi:MAG: hypothetical protein DMD63_10330 [Gemmatimonadetes bacterium]|nr:MAG: hypothetical protein DMD63_10330 [Gemmatimonadota bacterium]
MAAGASQDCRCDANRRQPRQRLDSQRDHGRHHRSRAGRFRHAWLLPLLRSVGSRGAGALHPLHTGGAIGIAVDANVLIFERIREELSHGKTVRTAIDEGFRHAMSAIVDSNVSTALTAAVLYQYGTGPVRGFAVTLLAGIAASMITAIFVVRTFYMIWLNRSSEAQTTLSI